MNRIGLLPRVLLAILLGVALGQFLPVGAVRVFVTFNGLFSQFLGFMIPLIIIGLVTAAIARIGIGAGKLLLATVVIAYLDTVVSALLAYGTGSLLFPSMVSATADTHIMKPEDLAPYFSVAIPPMIDVMSALVFSFLMGLCIAHARLQTLRGVFDEFEKIVSLVIGKVIIPLLPIYIFGIFLSMTRSGQVFHILEVFTMIILVIFVLHLFILFYEFVAAGLLTRRNPLKMLATMLPAYFTALGTASSAATIPVTMRQTVKNGVSESIAGFTIPLCATIHMSGSAMKITACALTVCLLNGIPYDFPLFLHFILLLAICMVAGPGVPGGAVMAALAPMSSVLGFGMEEQALIIALYIAMDSFGTACNVTGDGAIAVVLEKYFRRKD